MYTLFIVPLESSITKYIQSDDYSVLGRLLLFHSTDQPFRIKTNFEQKKKIRRLKGKQITKEITFSSKH